MLDWLVSCNERGLPVYGQGATLRVGLNLTLADFNLYDGIPAWREIATGTRAEKPAQVRRPPAPRGDQAGDEQSDVCGPPRRFSRAL